MKKGIVKLSIYIKEFKNCYITVSAYTTLISQKAIMLNTTKVQLKDVFTQ